MTMKSISEDQDQEIRRTVRPQSESEDAAQRLAGLLPEDALRQQAAGARDLLRRQTLQRVLQLAGGADGSTPCTCPTSATVTSPSRSPVTRAAGLAHLFRQDFRRRSGADRVRRSQLVSIVEKGQ